MNKVVGYLSLKNINWKLDDDVILKGKLTLTNSKLDINKHSIIINSDCNLDNTILDLFQGSLTVFGNLKQTDSEINVDGGYLSVTKDYGLFKKSLLIMNNSNDYVRIGGDFLTISTVGEKDHLTAGTMELCGNFSQRGNSYSF